MVLRKWC